MARPLDEQYLTWLYSQVGSIKDRNSHRTYWNLFRQLYRKEFVWFVPNDDNRAAEGVNLRYEFLDHYGIDRPDPHWLDLGCSMFELLIALARTFAFQTDSDLSVWFWHFIEVLELRHYTDAMYDGEDDSHDYDVIDSILDRIIFRTYDADGVGGLFPLANPREDQRKVELWYQMSAYIIELW